MMLYVMTLNAFCSFFGIPLTVDNILQCRHSHSSLKANENAFCNSMQEENKTKCHPFLTCRKYFSKATDGTWLFFASNKTSRRPIVTQGGRGHDQRTSTIEDLTTREPITHLQTSFYFSKAHGGHRPA